MSCMCRAALWGWRGTLINAWNVREYRLFSALWPNMGYGALRGVF